MTRLTQSKSSKTDNLTILLLFDFENVSSLRQLFDEIQIITIRQ